MLKNDVAIIGAGPAGVAAAIQLKRYGVDFLIFEKGQIGGLLTNANYIENYIGFPQGIGGKQMVSLIARHLKSLGVEVVNARVNSVDYQGNSFLLKTKSEEYQSNYLIIASGTKAIVDDSIQIDENAFDKIYYEIANIQTDDLNYVAIIGSGDAAFDYALNLSTKGVSSSIFMRNESPNALPLLVERAESDDRIRIINFHKLVRIELLNNLLLHFDEKGNKREVEADCILFAIGRAPELSFLNDDLISKQKMLIDDEKLVFIGDVKNKIYRQASISSGDGIFAAMKIYRKINQ